MSRPPKPPRLSKSPIGAFESRSTALNRSRKRPEKRSASRRTSSAAGKPDDVQVVALDRTGRAPRHVPGSRSRLPGPPTRRWRRTCRARAGSARGTSRRVASCSTSSQPGVSRQSPETTTCVLPLSSSSISLGFAGVRGLAEDPAVQHDRGVDAERPAGPRRGPRRTAPSRCACSRTICTASARCRRLFLVLRRDDVERNVQLFEDRLALRRRRREQQRRRRRRVSHVYARPRPLRQATCAPTPR